VVPVCAAGGGAQTTEQQLHTRTAAKRKRRATQHTQAASGTSTATAKHAETLATNPSLPWPSAPPRRLSLRATASRLSPPSSHPSPIVSLSLARQHPPPLTFRSRRSTNLVVLLGCRDRVVVELLLRLNAHTYRALFRSQPSPLGNHLIYFFGGVPWCTIAHSTTHPLYNAAAWVRAEVLPWGY